MKILLTISLCAILTTVLAGAKPPNFIFLISDDQSWSGLSCQMHPDMPDSKSAIFETPHIAKLASEGMRFSAAYSPSSVCSPSRISLQTGISPGCLQFTRAGRVVSADVGFKLVGPKTRRSISSDEVTVAQMLKTAGYQTAHYGKWHLQNDGPGASGYDESDGNTNNFTPANFTEPNPVDIYGMNDRATAFMKKSSENDKPFFIQMSYYALHYPENASKHLIDKYAKKLVNNSNSKLIERAAICEDLDRGVGSLLKQIDQLGLAKNTYVIYMADNGGIEPSELLRGRKGDCWEGGIRVPLIIRGPEIEANSWSHQRVVGFDFLPTFCELAGVTHPLPTAIEGGSFAHLFKGSEVAVKRPRPELVFHFPHYQSDTPHSALFLDDYKLVRHYEHEGSDRLYNITTDVKEQNNLAETDPERTQQMSDLLDKYIVDKKLLLPTANPNYDPENPPSIRSARGKGGKGRRRGKGRKGKG